MTAQPSIADAASTARRLSAGFPERYVYATLAGFAVVVLLVSVVAVLLGQGTRVGLLGVLAVTTVGALALTMRWPFIPVAVLLLAIPFLLTDIGAGIQVVHVMGAAASGGVLWAVLLRRGTFVGSPILLGGLVFMGSLIVAIMASATPTVSSRVALMYLLALGIGFATLQATRERAGALWIMRAWMVGVIVSIGPHLEAPRPVAVELGGGVVRGRLEGVFTQPNDLGEFCLLSFFCAIAFLWATDRWYDKLLGWLGLGLAVVALVLALSRGSFIGVGVGLIVLALLVPRFWRTLLIWGTATASALLIMVVTGIPAATVLVERVTSITAAQENPNDERNLIWQEAIRLWSGNQVTGIGPGGYLPSSQLGGSLVAPEGAYHAHNILLHVGAEAGIIGVIGLLIAVVIGTIYSLHLILGNAPMVLPRATNAALFAGMVGVGGHGLVDFEYANPVLISLAWVMIGLLAGGLRPPPATVGAYGSRLITPERVRTAAP